MIPPEVLSFMSYGVLDWPIWKIVVATLVLTHVTIAGVTIYLHRCQAHRALDLHPAVSHFFRFWLWLTTGMQTGEWAAIHRKHHAKCETVDDPHSPQVKGIRKVLFQGSELYMSEADNDETIDKYGQRHAGRLGRAQRLQQVRLARRRADARRRLAAVRRWGSARPSGPCR